MAIVSDPQKIRSPHFAATDGFYPDDPVTLTQQVAQFYRDAKRVTLDGNIHALIVPHAGYDYSGAIAASAFKQLEGLSFDTVVLIGPSHRAFFRGVSVYSGGAYRTPLGEVRLDLDFCRKLTSIDPVVALADIGHDATGGGWEHSLEVQLPLLQIVLGAFALVPIVMGDQEYPTAKKLGELVARFAKPGRTLVVASSDLAHGRTYAETKRLDRVAAESVTALSPSDLYDKYSDGSFEACGAGPITATIIAAKTMGADTSRVIEQTNSGDVTGDRQGYIVGYLSAAIFASEKRTARTTYTLSMETDVEDITDGGPVSKTRAHGEAKANRSDIAKHMQSDPPLTSQEREILRLTARRSLDCAIKGARFTCPEAPTTRLRDKRGVFVTLTYDGHLRGCIGYVRPYKPLIDSVWEMAESAATRDSRFLPVEPSEVDAVSIEITVLSELHTVMNSDDVLVGRHGIVISQGNRTGVLLPQVPIDNDWDRETFLMHACQKAELADDAWRDPKTTIEVFTAEVF